jgi:hypothetical protein
MNPIDHATQNISDRLTWHTANRDQAGIAKDLDSGRDIAEVYGLGPVGLFDEFFYFLEELGITKLFSGLDSKSQKRESPVPFIAVMLVYLMRIDAGLRFFWHIDPVILHCQPLMRLAGFNGREVRDGTCARGKKSCSKAEAEADDGSSAAPDGEQPTKIRGPVCPEFIASRVVAILGPALERVFNRTIAILAANKFFPKKVHAILDASEVESTEKCRGCGRVSKEKAPELRLRKGRIRKVYQSVFGFKIWVVWNANSRLPLAMRFATIEKPDIELAQDVIEQAIVNLGEHARIATIAMDRGFMDGPLLWWLNGQGIIFFIPAKSDMHVYMDACSLAPAGCTQTRQTSRTIGHGKNRT